VVAEMVPRDGRSHGQEIAKTCLPSRRSHVEHAPSTSLQPIKERLVREVGYGLALEGASAAALVRASRRRETE